MYRYVSSAIYGFTSTGSMCIIGFTIYFYFQNNRLQKVELLPVVVFTDMVPDGLMATLNITIK